jgi:hypothetical protein
MAAWTPLASSWAKFHRAGTHLDCLNDKIGEMADDPEAVTVERLFKGKDAFLVVTRVPDMREAGLIMGDAVSCYRAALDHLVWDLVKMGTHAALAPQQAKQVQFPFAQNAREFKAPNHRARRAPGIADADWRIIKGYQPYRRSDQGRAMRRLRDLSDTDKHRYIYPAFISPLDFQGNVRLINCAAEAIWMRQVQHPLSVGVKLVRVRLIDATPERDVQIESHITLQPSLGRSVSLEPALAAIRETVLEVLSRFEARFG